MNCHAPPVEELYVLVLETTRYCPPQRLWEPDPALTVPSLVSVQFVAGVRRETVEALKYASAAHRSAAACVVTRSAVGSDEDDVLLPPADTSTVGVPV